jgi:hypothetical protein
VGQHEGNPTNPQGGCTVPDSEGGTEIAGYLTGAFGWKFSSRLRATGEAGLGLATYSVGSSAGGDIFEPTCDPSPGVKPTLHLAAELSYAVLPYLRAVVTPLLFELHPSYNGVRTTPADVSGVWLRIGFGLGAAIDL